VATTIASSFSRFRTNLEITGLQQATVSTRQTNVRDAVARRLTVLDSFVTGSFRRHTMISPLAEADIDVFVVLDASYWSTDGQASVLDKVRSALLETYTKTPKISRNGQAVTITFDDFKVDVVPGFNRKGGGYLIPDSIGKRWISTNPKVHETFITNANAAHNGNLVPLIKMLKSWNRGISDSFRSFYLELLVEKALNGVTISNDWSGCRFAFDKGREIIKFKIADPADLDGDQVSGLLTASTVENAVARFETAFKRSSLAIEYESKGNVEAAVGEWRKVFGDYFPAYG
jgi:hypothetical protein